MVTQTLLTPKFITMDTTSTFHGLPVINAFSLRQAGNMSPKYGIAAQENFEKFCSTVGISPTNRVHIHPAHGNKVIKTGRYHRGASVVCDGLITTEQGLTLSLFPADYFPVIFTDEEGGFVGLIHGGRESVKQGIIANAVKLTERFVKSPVDLLVAIGPGIQACCYEINLQQLIVEDLYRAGISLKNIFFTHCCAYNHCCTYCSQDDNGWPLYFSHWRSRRKGELEGRFAAVTALR